MASNVGRVLKTVFGFIFLITGLLSFCGSALASIQGMYPILGNPFLLITQILMCLGGILLIKYKKKEYSYSIPTQDDPQEESHTVGTDSSAPVEEADDDGSKSVSFPLQKACFCRYCGANLREDANYCEICGKNIQ